MIRKDLYHKILYSQAVKSIKQKNNVQNLQGKSTKSHLKISQLD
jgi:hypothetical protein